MSGSQGFSFDKALIWIASAIKSLLLSFAKERDAKLKKYSCKIFWIEEGSGFTVEIIVKAENEDAARKFANEAAIKDLPVVHKFASKVPITPPYMKDAKASLTQWKVELAPLNDADRNALEDGTFGPAGAVKSNLAVG